jgi:hypothetical protein
MHVLAFMSTRNSNGIVGAPSETEPSLYAMLIAPSLTGNFAGRFHFSAKEMPLTFHASKIAPVFALLGPICPPAIIWAVIIRAVNSIKAHAVRSLAHIFQKVLKLVPSADDFDTYVVAAVRVLAANSSSHALPRHVSSGRERCSLAVVALPRVAMNRCFHGMDYRLSMPQVQGEY